MKELREGTLRKRIVLCIMGFILAWAGTVNAEPTLSAVLNEIYGFGNWEPYNAPDELWRNLNGQAKAEARFADAEQNFGFLPGAIGGTFQPLFNVTADGYLSGSPSATLSVAQTGDIFRFADDPSDYPLWSSKTSDNGDGMDHMRTYSITGGPSAGNYVIAWEDLPKCKSDLDYQDLVVEVSGVQPIPEPASFLLLGLGCMALRKKRRG